MRTSGKAGTVRQRWLTQRPLLHSPHPYDPLRVGSDDSIVGESRVNNRRVVTQRWTRRQARVGCPDLRDAGAVPCDQMSSVGRTAAPVKAAWVHV